MISIEYHNHLSRIRKDKSSLMFHKLWMEEILDQLVDGKHPIKLSQYYHNYGPIVTIIRW